MLSACEISESTFDFTKPGSPSMRWIFDGPPKKEDGKEYPPLYDEGWKDGCETGATAGTNAFYKFFGGFKQDAYKAQDPTYHTGWKDSFNYCQRYIYQYNRKIGF